MRDWNEEDFDANFLLKELHVKYGATPYFQISVQPNPLFPGHSSISISPAGLGLPDRKYYYGVQDDPVSTTSTRRNIFIVMIAFRSSKLISSKFVIPLFT